MSTKNNYVIAIPSYKREQTILKYTLSVLKRSKINTDLIYIFVANKEEKNNYILYLPQEYHKNIIIGIKTLYKQRNFISDYFPTNTYIIQMDDDIRKINKLINYNSKIRKENKIQELLDLDSFFRSAYKKMIENGSHIWGVYPINNAYFMFPRITTDLRFLVGPLFGIINRKNKKLKLTIEEKEDFQRTLQYFTLDKVVIRFNNITIDTSYYKTKGGLQHSKKNRKEESLKSALYLHKKYPDLTRLKKKVKKSGITEIELLRKKTI